MEALGKFVIWLLLAVVAIFTKAWALVNLWTWFVVPLGVVSISMPWALGLSTLIGFVTFQFDPSLLEYGERVENSNLKVQLFNILFAVIVLFAGWVYHSFM